MGKKSMRSFLDVLKLKETPEKIPNNSDIWMKSESNLRIKNKQILGYSETHEIPVQG